MDTQTPVLERAVNVLNIITVHWQSSEWIEPQLRYLDRHLDQPYRVYASLNGIDDPSIRGRFHYAEDLEGTHAEKLNELGRTAIEQSDSGDRLLFLDGDAFPVRPLDEWMRSSLTRFPLVAVRRDENLGDRQPHPCFCFTTCDFWDAVGGDWREGGTWVNSVGDTVTDVGGNLLELLSDRGAEWLPLLRTNTRDVDPLWFAVYAHRVYHHGAGFRARLSRITYHDEDVIRERAPVHGSSLQAFAARVARRPSLLLRIRPSHARSAARATSVTMNQQRRKNFERRKERSEAKIEQFEQKLLAQIRTDPEFFLQLDDTRLT